MVMKKCGNGRKYKYQGGGVVVGNKLPFFLVYILTFGTRYDTIFDISRG